MDIQAFHPRGDSGVEFPDDGVGKFGDLGGGDVFTEEFDFIAARDVGVIGQADDDLVHGDAADDGMAFAANENLRTFSGDVAGKSVSISDPDGGDTGGLGGDVGAAVGNAVAGGQGAHEGDAGFEGHHIAKSGLEFRDGRSSVDHEAGSG